MHRNAMNAEADRIRQGLACLSEPSRFRIAMALLRGVWSVSRLAGEVGLSQSCTTRHLQALERAGLVRRERDGKRVLHHLCVDRPEVESLRALLGGQPVAAGSAPARAGRARKAAANDGARSGRARAGMHAVGDRAAADPAPGESAGAATADAPRAVDAFAARAVPAGGSSDAQAATPHDDRPPAGPARRPPASDLEDFLL